MKRFFGLFSCLCIVVCFALPALAAEVYPKRPVTIICPYGVGGGTDVMSRQIAKQLAEKLKVPFQVINITGSSGGVALANAMNKKADGYTILGYTTGMYQMGIEGKVPYKLGKDYESLAMLAVMGTQFYSYPKAPWKNGKEFLAYVKDNPGKVTVAVAEIISNDGQVFGHLFKDGYKLKPVVYSKAGELQASVLGGHNLAALTRYTNVIDHLKTGMLVPTLSLSNSRISALPDTDCLSDVGISGWTEAQCFYQGLGLAIIKGIPSERLKILNDAIGEIVKTKEWKDFMVSRGWSVEESFPSPESMDKYLEGYKISEEYGKIALELLK